MTHSAMRCIALFNSAGGVAKSTLTFQLGYHFASEGKRVLLIDMDSQATLTYFMGLQPNQLEKTVYDALMDSEGEFPIHTDINKMDLLPSNLSLSLAESQLAQEPGRDFLLKYVIESVKERYDCVLIDCPPSIGLFSMMSLIAATELLVPVQTHFKALAGTGQLLQLIHRVKKRANRNLKVLGFVPTIYAKGCKADEEVLSAMRDRLGTIAKVFEPIPRTTAFVQSSAACQPLALYAPKHPANRPLEGLGKAVLSVA